MRFQMYTREQLAALEWHPIKHGKRTENYALSVMQVRPLIYWMACGHQSVPRQAICERGCKMAPAYPMPRVWSEEIVQEVKLRDRYGVMPRLDRGRGLEVDQKGLLRARARVRAIV